MAQQLKLETFIDSLGFNLDDSKPGQKTQKLSIAGSSILLDIDFETDNKIVGLSLSVNAGDSLEQQNNHREIGPPNHTTNGQSSSHISIVTDELGIHHVKLNCNNNPISFLNKPNDLNKTQVEQILLRNLQASKLGNFPVIYNVWQQLINSQTIIPICLFMLSQLPCCLILYLKLNSNRIPVIGKLKMDYPVV